MRPATIAVDGPAASGKSTIGHALAARLGYAMVDTGVFYRLIALRAMKEDVPRDDAEARGRVVYMKNCYHCHQGGEGGLGPALLRLAPGPVIRTQIRAGLGAMPGFSHDEISPADMDALIPYLKTSRKSAGFFPHTGPDDVSPLGR